LPLDEKLGSQIYQLALFNGDSSIIDDARGFYSDAADDLLKSLDHMQAVVESVQAKYPDTMIHCDLSELRGYSYHTGLVFAAFLPGQGKEIARGGRYDDVGSVFGNARAATGFSADLLNLYQLSPTSVQQPVGILAPNNDDPELEKVIKALRAENQRVVVDLTDGAVEPADQHCDRVLENQSGAWVVREV
jgi:ATP phosphoribosyltransferase regulatory subunit